MARDFDQHLRELATAFAGDPSATERCRRFVASFVRPCGVAQPAAPVMVDAIERTAAIRKRPRLAWPWQYAARWAVLAASRSLRV